MGASSNCIDFFDRLHLAEMAAQRAQLHCFDANRFNGEYETARMWHNYKCYITTNCKYVESNWP